MIAVFGRVFFLLGCGVLWFGGVFGVVFGFGLFFWFFVVWVCLWIATEQQLNCSEGGFPVFSGFLSSGGGREGSGWSPPYSFLHFTLSQS